MLPSISMLSKHSLSALRRIANALCSILKLSPKTMAAKLQCLLFPASLTIQGLDAVHIILGKVEAGQVCEWVVDGIHQSCGVRRVIETQGMAEFMSSNEE